MTNFDDQPYDPFNTQTGDNRSVATRPGLVRLSAERLARMHPELYASTPSPWQQPGAPTPTPEDEMFKVHAAEHLRYGLAEPAIVIATQPLIVAAYAHELDAVAHLGFFNKGRPATTQNRGYPVRLGDELIQRFRLRKGSRLLTVNTFQRLSEAPYAPDLIPGPQARGVYGNFSPYIAEFLTSSLAEVEKRKKLIEAWEWKRCQQLADEFHGYMVDNLVRPRDGLPMRSLYPITQDWLPGHSPPHLRQ